MFWNARGAEGWLGEMRLLSLFLWAWRITGLLFYNSSIPLTRECGSVGFLTFPICNVYICPNTNLRNHVKPFVRFAIWIVCHTWTGFSSVIPALGYMVIVDTVALVLYPA